MKAVAVLVAAALVATAAVIRTSIAAAGLAGAKQRVSFFQWKGQE